MVLAAFLAFDLSMLGYLRSTAAGATTYNAVHNYAFPALAALAALALEPVSGPSRQQPVSSRVRGPSTSVSTGPSGTD